MKQYEERRAAAKTPPSADAAAPGPASRGGGMPEEDPAPAGMMAGVSPGVSSPQDEKKKFVPVTAFGRYVKVLLSSNEFVFVS
jgi:hypothetical protein